MVSLLVAVTVSDSSGESTSERLNGRSFKEKSSLRDMSTHGVLGVSAGASLTAVTLVPRLTWPADQLPEPPIAVETFWPVPALRAPCEPSASRTVSAPGVPLKFAAGTKRSQWLAGNTTAEVSDNPELAIVVQPEVPVAEYCHVPCTAVAALPVIATPCTVPPSAGSLKLAPKRTETIAPGGSAVSSATPASMALPLATGASLTAVTLVPRLTWPADQLPEPPIAVETFWPVPALRAPCEPSASRTVSAPGVPLKFAAGTKRSQCVAGSTTAEVSDNPVVSTVVQPEVPVAEYCHVPCTAVAALPVIATPASAVACAPSVVSE